MSENSNTDFFEFEPGDATTVLRFSLSAERANEVIREYISTAAPEAEMLDEIHILISTKSIKRSNDRFPVPAELIDSQSKN